MTECVIQFELDQDEDAKAIAERLQARLSAQPGVEEADVQAQETRFGVAEAVSVIAAGVVLVGQGKSLVVGMKEFVSALKDLLVEIDGLKNAYIELRGKRVAVADLTEQQLTDLASDRA